MKFLLPLCLFGLAIVAGVLALGGSSRAATRMSAPYEALPLGVITEEVTTAISSPVAMAFDPSGRLFFAERGGDVRLIAGGVLQAAPVIHFNVDTCFERGLVGVALDPAFAQNHYVYVQYTAASNCSATQSRVVRFVESGGVGSNPTVIFSSTFNGVYHTGNNIHFGPDGKLYVSTGDNFDASNGQNVTVKHGKMHRINPDGTIPADNPVFTQTGALSSLYAMGLRNSFDFTFDKIVTGRIFATENGPSCDDEMNRIEAGWNYGWRTPYPCDDRDPGGPSPLYNTIAPLWYVALGPCCLSPTGVEVYSSTLIPEWQDQLFMCTYNNGILHHLYLSDDRLTVTNSVDVEGVTCNMDIETAPDGSLYYIQAGGVYPGGINRITRPGGPPTATATATRPASRTATNTPTRTPSNTVTPSATDTPSSTSTPTNTNTATATDTATESPTPNGSETATPTPDLSVTPSETATGTATGTATAVEVPSETSTATNTATNTPTVTNTWTPAPVPTSCGIQFEDVPSGSTFYAYIQCLACKHILGGYECGGPGEPCNGGNDPYFHPSANISRGQLAKIVSNSAGFREPTGFAVFQDVPEATSPFFIWVQRLANRGFMQGYPCGGPGEPCIAPGNKPYFRPGAQATRAQISKIVANAAGLNGAAGAQAFEDVAPGSTFYDFIQRLAHTGAIGGYPCGGVGEPCGGGSLPYFRPGANATRGQVSKIVSNAFFPFCMP